jgi:carboxyl-terminal processing protease
MADKETGYLRITQFGEPTYREFMQASTQLLAQGMSKLVLDLRDNGGGYLNAATEIADEFLPEGALIVYTQGNARQKQVTLSKRMGKLVGVDVVVLINEHSASASEIVAGALQDNDRGTIMGRRSFGKGLVQEQHQWEDGSAIRLTIARYYTPTGRSIQRPYGQDVDYEGDLIGRYERGDLYAVDSSLFVDSLRYVTPGGKVVYGGGGIMPDVFIPLDTTGYSEYAVKLRYRDVFNHFAFELLDSERAKITAQGYKKFANDYRFDTATLLRLAEYGAVHHSVPYTKEQGILMLADGVEASCRSMKDTTYSKLENQINRIVDSNVADGQLSNCPLTFQQIQIIKESFLRILKGVYHSRIEYPEEAKAEGQGKKKAEPNGDPEEAIE